MHIVYPSKRHKTAYPLSTFTYVIVPQDSARTSAQAFVLYAMTDGQKFGPALDFAPLPGVVIRASRSTLDKL